MKKLILMRGVSGSGKSHLAKQLAEENPGSVIYSTDDFFMVKGKYQFDPKLIAINHKKNQDRAIKAMQDEVPCIIIDNTNTQLWEMRPYVEAAKEYGYEIDIRQPDPVSFEELMKRQESRKNENKSLPPDVIRGMLNRFQPLSEFDNAVGEILKSKSTR